MTRSTRAYIRAIEYHLPEAVLSTDALAEQFPEWSVPRIDSRTGIRQRHIAAADECASDLAFEAANKLFASTTCAPADIDFILLCTQSPDYLLPTTACTLQQRLGIPSHTGALDFNLGHSGFVYGLGLAKGLIETNQARNVLLLTAETYSKYVHPRDKSTRTIFGDAGAATLVSGVESEEVLTGPFLYGTDGSGAESLIVRTGASRHPRTEQSGIAVEDDTGNVRSADNLFMDGAQVFSFTIGTVPGAVEGVLNKSGLTVDDIDLFVFHQANKFILDQLRRKSGIAAEKFYIAIEDTGNTVSSTIPVALRKAQLDGTLRPGMRVLLAGYGVGLSWATVVLHWTAEAPGAAKL